MKMPRFGIKNALFEYFLARDLNKLLPCFILAPSNLPNSKILKKRTKMTIFGTKNDLFEYFWTGI